MRNQLVYTIHELNAVNTNVYTIREFNQKKNQLAYTIREFNTIKTKAPTPFANLTNLYMSFTNLTQ